MRFGLMDFSIQFFIWDFTGRGFQESNSILMISFANKT